VRPQAHKRRGVVAGSGSRLAQAFIARNPGLELFCCDKNSPDYAAGSKFSQIDLADCRAVEVFFNTLIPERIAFAAIFASESQYCPMGTSVADETALISRNICIAYNIIAHFGRILCLEERYGCAVILSSINATIPVPGFASYCISKAAIDCLVACACREFSPFLRVNAVAPGPVHREDGVFHAFPGFLSGLEERHLTAKRLAHPADVVPMVEFLLSEAAGWITGQTLVVDGGVSRHWGSLQAIP